ncbi:c-type cytochrome [Pusillimonas noertemannii]|uniref:c-type cytochrome n=1 Tax=Pusillimonas noertemannii TaxID=305977 RepID=UPI0002F8A5CC|nr:cytochrome c [Pusillimonas noertemannii]
MTEPKFSQQQREQPEPSEGNRPVPKLVLTIIVGLFIWAVYYLYATYSPMPPSLGDNRVAADFAVPALADGGQLYTANCVACHQASGKGLPGVFPPLSGSEWVSAEDPGVMIKIVLHGVQGPLTVEGAKYEGLMPHFHDKLSDEEMAALVNHVRTSFGNSASTTDAKYVAQIREETKGQATPWKGDEDLRPLLEQ